MIYFISYDITDAKRLNKVAKILENYGLRIQYSFFECEMQSSKLQELKQELLQIIDTKKDSLMIYPLCEKCAKNTISIGDGDIFIPASFEIL